MSETEKRAGWLGLRLRPGGLISACGAILLCATILAFFGEFWWFLDLFSHFRVQYFLGLSLVALVLAIGRRFRSSALFAAAAFINLCTILPLYVGGPPPPVESSRSHRALLMNVNTESGEPQKVAEAIRQIRPDIVALEEVNESWLSGLSEALREYPFSQSQPREDNFGIAVYSKYPLVESEVRSIGEADVPSVIAELDLPDGRITVIATHPLPPGGREGARLRNDQLGRLSELGKQARSPVLLLGDLNATPWCSHFKELLSSSGLRDSCKGRGVQGTWPTSCPIFLIPIDHCLYSPGIHVTGRSIGPKVGSDHYPLVVDFVLLPPVEGERSPAR